MGFFFRPLASFALVVTLADQQHGQRHGVSAFASPVGATPLGRSSSRWAVAPKAADDGTTAAPAGARYDVRASFDDDLIEKYDAFILDQFGVLHNGNNALDGAVALVERLISQQKRLIILSNTSAPAAVALAKLPRYGFNGAHFEDAVTSGEESSRYIKSAYGSTDTVQKALMFTWDGAVPNNPRRTVSPEAYLEKCGNVGLATSVADADFVLFHGSEVWYRGDDALDDVPLAPFLAEGVFTNVDPLLRECAAAGLPAVCANPDFVVNAGDNGFAHMPGKLARRYEEDDLGGTCTTFGKPGAEHFAACVRKLGLDRSRVCHVGDSLHHDVAGAVAADVPVVLITSGIHRSRFGTDFGALPNAAVLEEVMEDEVGAAVRPTHVVPAFRR